MRIRIGFNIDVELSQTTTILTAMDVEAARAADVTHDTGFQVQPWMPVERIVDSFGNVRRRFTTQPGLVTLSHAATIIDDGQPDPVDWNAAETPVSQLPADMMRFLVASRYCETDLLGDIAWSQFGHLIGAWTKVQAVCNFVHSHLTFGYQYARSTRTGFEAYNERVGVCRDFTHLAVTLCRCLNIPARYCNGYLGDIGVPADPAPMDFNAWFEAYIGGRWYTFDPRHNMPRIGRVVVARGRDAMDIPMLHTFGPHALRRFEVITHEITGADYAVAA